MMGDNRTYDHEMQFEDAAFRVRGNPLNIFDELEIIDNIYESPELLNAQ